MRIAFCVRTSNPGDLDRSEFYRQDIELLESLGHDVVCLTHPLELLRRKVDLCFVWWWNYLWAWGAIAATKAIPVIVTGTYDFAATNAMPFWKRWMKKGGLRFAKLHMFVSQLELEAGVAEYPSLAHLMVMSPHVVDIEVYHPPAVRRPSSVPLLLNVAWQKREKVERKKLPQLIRAVAQLKRDGIDVRLVLAGPPVDGGQELQALARNLGVEERVEFPGELSRDAKVSAMQHCELYVQVSEFEGFGVAIAEALACGAPVLVSPVGAVPEVVGDVGAYWDDRSGESLASAIIRSISAASGDVRLRGRERICTHFSPERRRRDIALAIARVVADCR